ncbi:Retrovirus-related Pol polyprotein from transposon RE1 [Vitis vinifera]|uniref:Retrovirus-related Pol polyprotein from transposon RE1 n=1 Tax=Vitis vinifera TaxID=29760 RepID=A0A438CAI8_VITVI|nr:Retrovirus-related Pol polyprotein from transposon RE1 [Vitis vinifera]
MVVRQRSTILRQALILISQPSNALTAIRLIPPVWISHNFKATTLGFQENLDYNCCRNKNKANVAEKASALVAATDHGGFTLRPSSQKIVSTPMDIQTRQTIGCGIKRGKLYYLDLQSKDSNKLQQALMADDLRRRRKSLKFGCGIDNDMVMLDEDKDEVNLLFQKFHKMIETQYNAKGEYHKEIQTLDYDYHIYEEDESGKSELVNQEADELDMSGQQFGSEDVFTEIPNQSSSAESVLNLEPDPFMKRLPHRHNRGIPKPTYEPELSTKEALTDPRWKAVMNEEMKSLQKNETWELIECPPGKKPVGCRWIYTMKYKADGSIERFKARLVAKGYTQTYGIDYTETFAPVAKINTIRILLSLAANLDWPLQQFDVKNVFLHGELSEEVYMDLPPGCMVSEKQCQKLQEMKPEERKALQNYLSREFEMKDLGPLKYFLGIKVSRSSEGIFLSQRKYALDLLQETGMSGCQPVNTPIEEGLKLCVESNQVSTDKGRYQRLVGRLMYLAHTRPDLAYALSVVSQYMHNPGEQHMNAVMRILRRSTSGYFTFVGGNLVTWKSKKQNVVARSSAEAEFRAACDIAHNPVQHGRTKHVEVDRFFIKEKLDDKIVELPKIRSENQLADILTKAVSSQVFSKFLDKLGMCDIYAPT